MKLSALSFLAIRILCIYLIILGLSHMVNFLSYALPTYLLLLESNVTYLEVLLIVGVPALILILSAIVLWIFAGKISRYLLPKHVRESDETIPMKEMEGFILSVIGLILIIFSFTSIVRMSMDYMNVLNKAQWRISATYQLIELVIRLLIGLFLILRAEGIASFLKKVRRN